MNPRHWCTGRARIGGGGRRGNATPCVAGRSRLHESPTSKGCFAQLWVRSPGTNPIAPMGRRLLCRWQENNSAGQDDSTCPAWIPSWCQCHARRSLPGSPDQRRSPDGAAWPQATQKQLLIHQAASRTCPEKGIWRSKCRRISLVYLRGVPSGVRYLLESGDQGGLFRFHGATEKHD